MKEKSPEDCSLSVDPRRIVKLQNFGILRNFLGSFRKSSAIVGSSSETLALGRKKISLLGSEIVGRYKLGVSAHLICGGERAGKRVLWMGHGALFAVLSDVVFTLEFRAVFTFSVRAEPEVAAHVVLEFRW